MTPKNNVSYRVGQLEKNFEKVDFKLDKIMTNHLPHIQKELIKLSTQIKVFTTINIAAIILGIIIQRLLS